ncbi:MAG: RnfABCDGE type electron transport complex subunit D [Caldisericum exile]|uniref:RnfABCDGE type electron transport complex subunit D n=1 Tax=Caldisericum exile TaxID=693075 RepID=UPI003C73018B
MANYDIDLVVTSAPHIKDKVTTSSIMRDVIIAIAPALIGSVFIFGLRSILVIIISVVSSILAEVLGNIIFHKKPSLNDLSASVSGLLLAMTLPPSSPWWMVVVGAFSGIILGKMIFGGIGSNPFNPALVGRSVLMVSWPTYMTTWIKPQIIIGLSNISQATPVDSITTATPLGIVKLQSYAKLISDFGTKANLYKALFFGTVGGSLGETSALLLLIGGIYLIARKVIDWKIPVIYIGTVFVLSPLFGRDPLFSILAGGLFLGAFFMATDYSSSPITPMGKVYYAIFIGFLTVLIRQYSSYPEGVMFSILLGNAVVPYFDKVMPKVYGVFSKKEVAK